MYIHLAKPSGDWGLTEIRPPDDLPIFHDRDRNSIPWGHGAIPFNGRYVHPGTYGRIDRRFYSTRLWSISALEYQCNVYITKRECRTLFQRTIFDTTTIQSESESESERRAFVFRY